MPRKPLTPEELVSAPVALGSLPRVYLDLVAEIRDPRSNSTRIAAVIQQDPSLSARLLKLVNSAFYGFPRQIATVSQAVTMIGTQQLSDLTLATTVIQNFQDIPQHLLQIESFWQHSLATGICARQIAENGLAVESERLFVGGLLHDIGRLLLCQLLPEEMTAALRLAADREWLLVQAEKEVLGFTHAEVGGELLRRWQLPEVLRQAVEYHHRPARAKEHRREAVVIHLADAVVNALQLGGSGTSFVPPIWTEAWHLAELELEDVDSLVDQTRALYDELQLVFLQAA